MGPQSYLNDQLIYIAMKSLNIFTEKAGKVIDYTLGGALTIAGIYVIVVLMIDGFRYSTMPYSEYNARKQVVAWYEEQGLKMRHYIEEDRLEEANARGIDVEDVTWLMMSRNLRELE